MRRTSLAMAAAAAALAASSAANAAAPASASTGSAADPAEKVNRTSFAVYEFFDRILLRPAALTYKAITPKPLRLGIENALNNLGEPVVAANDFVQGRFHKAGESTFRFAINSVFGMLGAFDVAKRAGVPRHDNGFALTLGRAGVKPGPYLFVPLLGPSTVRDLIGSGVDVVSNPFYWLARDASPSLIAAKTVIGGLDARASADADLTALTSTATDPYATLRSVYLQNQQSKIDDQANVSIPALPDFDDSIGGAPSQPLSPAPASTQPASAPAASPASAPAAPPSAAPPSTPPPPSTPSPATSASPQPASPAPSAAEQTPKPAA